MFIPVILSGGSGTRLWPVSRELHPKPFIRLSDGQSLLQKAFICAAGLPDTVEVLTVTNRELYFKTEDEYRSVNTAQTPTSFILEPFGRNTAPAVAVAAKCIAEKYGNDAVMLMMPADHLISDQAAFRVAVSQAVQLAQQDYLVTFGITPDSPESGYGYIEAVGNAVRRFVEKPSRDKAQEYLAAGNYLWNAGIFCFRVGAVLDAFVRHAPEVMSGIQKCLSASGQAGGSGFSQLELQADAFADVPDISIDYALMEKAAAAQSGSKLAVVPCNIGWSDIGSWNAISDLEIADKNGNQVVGEALLYDASNCFIQSNERLVGAVGVKNLIIVDTPDALLVADKACSQDVKQIVGQLKERGHEAYKLHTTVHRPWGTYTVLDEGERFKIKRIVVKPRASLSLQMHHHRSEHWIVASGMAKVIVGDRELLVGTNESAYIHAGHKHRLENPGVVDLVLIEVQCGDYLGEDDIVRFEDVYGRIGQ